MHISLPYPSAGSRPRVRLRCSRRPDHSSSKSSFALLGASRRAPGQYSFFIPRFCAIRGRLIPAGYVRHGKAGSNYIRDTGIPPRARSTGQLKNNRSSTGQAVPTQLLPFVFSSLLFFPLLASPCWNSLWELARYARRDTSLRVKGPGKESGAKRDTFTEKRAVKRLIDIGGID